MKITEALARLLEGTELARADMMAVMGQIMGGEASPAQIAGFLVALRGKGESVEEIVGAATAMREFAQTAHFTDAERDELVDTCGTGGDASGLFNVSTASAIACAAAGAKVAKHGNRSVSSRSGSADVLAAAGVRVDLTPDAVVRCVRELGIGFLFAPAFHPAMKHAIGPRRELGVRTVFNLLGPLTNPAGARNQVLGVFDAHWLEPMARVLGEMGSRHVLVVHGNDGLDEVSLSAATQVAELRDGGVSHFTVQPEDFDLERCALEELQVDGPEASLALIEAAFAGQGGAAGDMIALNGGAALYAAGVAADWADGVARIQQVLANGGAAAKLQALRDLSQELAPHE